MVGGRVRKEGKPRFMDSFIDKIYRVFRFLLDNVIGYSAIVIMLGGTTLAISEVARRYLFGVVFDWGQDAVTYSIVGAIFLYFAVTQARRSHLRMSALMDVLEERGWVRLVLVIRTFFTALGLVVYSAIAYWGVSTMERSMELGRKTYSMVLVIWPFQAILLAAFILLALVCLFQLYQDIRALMGKKVFEWAPVDEGIEI
jgi:TRAP-type C4-dicarboxylate transport system permease small subunit